jgi:hypothetical protein
MMPICEIYILMDESIEIAVAEQIGSSSKVVSRSGNSDPCDPCFIQTAPRKKIPAQIFQNGLNKHTHHVLNHEKGGNPT